MEGQGKKESQFWLSSSEKRHQASGQSEETVLSDSDLEILSELIRTPSPILVSNLSFSPQLCIDI